MRTHRADETPDEPVASRRPLVLAGVTGFVVGAGVLGLLWTLSSNPDGPTADARAACEALARAGPLPTGTVSRGTLGPGVLAHINAARELAAAAAEGNPVYDDLSAHLEAVSRMATGLNFANPTGRRHLAQAQQICDQL